VLGMQEKFSISCICSVFSQLLSEALPGAGSTKQSACQLLVIDLKGFYVVPKVSAGRTPVHSISRGHCPDAFSRRL
ncbi:hypothetical protein, partial [Klebsiella michiganensis]|uniref:hypothetical protein n=1 Tax=Klebsiella michiganensis TaxID=1134687 RepID=UPI001952FC58